MMTKTTERLLQIGAFCAIIYFGWLGIVQLVVTFWNGQMATQRLAACQADLAMRPPAPAPTASVPSAEKK